MFLTMFFKTQNIVQTMHLTMLIAHPYACIYVEESVMLTLKLFQPDLCQEGCTHLCIGYIDPSASH